MTIRAHWTVTTEFSASDGQMDFKGTDVDDVTTQLNAFLAQNGLDITINGVWTEVLNQ